MRRVKWPFLGLALTLLLGVNLACVLALPGERTALFATATQIRDNLQASGKRGFLNRRFVDSDGSVHRYAVFVPYDMTEEDRLPLILYLNGGGKNGDDGIKPLLDGLAPVLWERKRDFPFVVAFPQCPKDDSWQPEGQTARRALRILDKTAREYHTDPDRVLITGLSAGGWGALAIAAAYPERFAGVIPFSAKSTHAPNLQSIADAQLPVWSFYVDGDDTTDDSNRTMYRTLLDSHSSPQFTELDDPHDIRQNGHNSWDFGFRNSALYSWLWNQRRTEQRALQPKFSLLLNDGELKDWTVLGNARWEFEGKDLLCTPRGTQGRTLLASNQTWRNFELHVEFRTDSSAACGLVFLSALENEPLKGWSLEIVPSEQGSGGLYDLEQQTWLQPCDPLAQRALVRGGWNDLRIQAAGDAITATLNGWPLVGLRDEKFNQPMRHVGLSVVAEDEKSLVRWRNMRIREIPEPSNISASLPTTATPLPSTITSDNRLDVSLEQIIEAWRQREERLRAARVSWTVDRSGINRWSGFRSGLAPATESPDGGLSSLTVNGDQIRYDTRWWRVDAPLSRSSGLAPPEMHPRFQRMLEFDFASQTDGPTPFSRYIDANSRIDYAAGSQSRAVITDPGPQHLRADGDLEDLYYQPVVLALRPLAKCGFGIEPQQSRIISNNSFVNGSHCVLLEETRPDSEPPVTRWYWIDPNRNYVVLRYLAHAGSEPREQLDIQYEPQADGNWLPHRWSAAVFPKASAHDRKFPGQKRVFQHAAAAVVDWSLQSPDAGPSVEPQLPAGTIVQDRRTNDWFEIRENGAKRPLDRDAIMEITLASSTVDQSEPFWHWRRPFVWGAAGIFLLVGYAGWRRRRASSKPPTQAA